MVGDGRARQAMMSPAVSIIIAVYSELESLNRTIEQLLTGFADIAIEIIIVAHPNSGETCLENGKRWAGTNPRIHFHIQQQLPGQGFAYREGIQLSRGEFILLMNADLETDPADARRLYDAILHNGMDMVIASRWCQGSDFDAASYGRIKIILNFLFQRLFGIIFRTSVTDLTFCYKIARAALFRQIRWRGTQHEFAMETTLLPIVLGMRIMEIPTRWRRRREGVSHFKFSRNLRHVRLALFIAHCTFTGKLVIFRA